MKVLGRRQGANRERWMSDETWEVVHKGKKLRG